MLSHKEISSPINDGKPSICNNRFAMFETFVLRVGFDVEGGNLDGLPDGISLGIGRLLGP